MTNKAWPEIRPHYQRLSKFCNPYSVCHALEVYLTFLYDLEVHVAPLPIVVKAFRAKGFLRVFNRAVNIVDIAAGLNKYGHTARINRNIKYPDGKKFSVLEIKGLKVISSDDFPTITQIKVMLEKSPLVGYLASGSHAVTIVDMDDKLQKYTVIDPGSKKGYRKIRYAVPFNEVYNVFPIL